MAVNINWDAINKVLGSKAAENVLAVGGSFMANKGAADQADRARADSLGVSRAGLLQRQSEQDSGDQIARSSGVLANSHLGENESFATKNALLREILPALRNSNIVAGDPAVAAAMGQQHGGFRIPEGGFSPEVLEAISKAATGAAIGERQQMRTNLDPNAPISDLAAMGLDHDGSQSAMLTKYRDAQQQEQAANTARQRDLIMRALDEDIRGTKQKSGGFKAGLGKVLKVAAPFAAFIPGVGPLASMGISAAAGGLGSALDGGGAGGVVANAAMSAAGNRMMPAGRTPPVQPAPRTPAWQPALAGRFTF